MKFLRTRLRSASDIIARAHVGLFPEKKTLMIFLYHGLFEDEREMAANLADPLEGMTVARLRESIEYFLEKGFAFASPDDIPAALDSEKKYALLTFDDGYFNNYRAVPILKEYEVPAVFFIATDFVCHCRCYWWDVLYRERTRQGRPREEIYQEAAAMKTLTTDRIEERLKVEFGERAFEPVSDLDRPMTPAELRAFADEKFVHLGNHTMNHAILTNYASDGIVEEIRGCQEALRAMTGRAPRIISYPNGNYSEEVIAVSRQAGLELGLTVEGRKNPLPLDPDSLMRLGRFIPAVGRDMRRQYDLYRSDLHPIDYVRDKTGWGY